MLTILESGHCICKYEPRGDYGLEGYQLNEMYRYEVRHNDKDGTYYKVFPDKHLTPLYGETCSKKQFNKCFDIAEYLEVE